MNPVVEEMTYLMHYGIKRRSGRYPWGSGEDPYQHGRDLYGRIEELKKQGWTETPENIKKEFGMTTTQYRAEKALAKAERRKLQVERAKSLRDDGLSPTEIGREMGVNESTVRSWFNEKSEVRMNQARNTANVLKQLVDEKGMIDVGTGAHYELGVSREKLNQALKLLEEEGYVAYSGGIPQATNAGQQTTQKVLCPPHIKPKPGAKAPSEIYDYENIHTVGDYTSRDGGETFSKFVYPKSMDSKRLMIRYADDVGPDGARGIDKDGIVELRRGVDDLSLGGARYSQVRILVDNDRYIKGMAVYSDNMPDGVDVIFNTNKKSDVPMRDVLKTIKKDPNNPFGSLIKASGQSTYLDKDGNEQLSLINKRADEGDWSEWKDALPSQFLGKQSKAMAQKQLNLAKADKLAEYEEICSLTNPTIKKHLLKKFADGCDSAAIHLQAAALPGQKYHVIIPVNTLKDNEVYAPGYKDGTKLALIRYPHGGIFEIPVLKVNNKNPLGKELLGTTPLDAVGINKKIADQLSGADFDGDTVMCIPTHDKYGKVKIAHRDYLEDLVGFEPKEEYGRHEVKVDKDGKEHYYRNGVEYKIMKNTGTQMGVISNLITDMTLAGAPDADLAKAVKHSMVVIDAEKHKLDYKQSEIDNDISSLKQKYQRKVDENGNVTYGGAATILSRAKGQYSVDKRQGTPKVNLKGTDHYDPSKPEGAYIYKTADDLYYPERVGYDKDTGVMTLRTTSGKKVSYNVKNKDEADAYSPVKRVDPDTGEVTYTNKAGDISYKVATRKQQSTRMAETDDAYSLVSEARHGMELIYADYANSMKSLANQARKEVASTGKIKYDAGAKATYSKEVASLYAKLNDALKNAPREREANRRTAIEVRALQEADPNMKKGDIKKAKQQSISRTRAEVGAKSRRERNIDISDKEWEAIQAGAISESKLIQILDNTDISLLRQRATPRATSTLSTPKINQIKAMSASNYTLDQIADKLGVSRATVSKYLKGVN